MHFIGELPHAVPSVTLPVGMHVCVPIAHVVMPVWQTFPPGLHEVMEMHIEQTPLLQTMFIPHDVPSFAGTPLSMQLATPFMQTVEPWLHGFAGTQGAIGVQGWHRPPLQYMSVPHEVPSGALPAAVHTGWPVVQEVFIA
jgi:hypothetical protein